MFVVVVGSRCSQWLLLLLSIGLIVDDSGMLDLFGG